jgi:hypothetical protein
MHRNIPSLNFFARHMPNAIGLRAEILLINNNLLVKPTNHENGVGGSQMKKGPWLLKREPNPARRETSLGPRHARADGGCALGFPFALSLLIGIVRLHHSPGLPPWRHIAQTTLALFTPPGDTPDR